MFIPFSRGLVSQLYFLAVDASHWMVVRWVQQPTWTSFLPLDSLVSQPTPTKLKTIQQTIMLRALKMKRLLTHPCTHERRALTRAPTARRYRRADTRCNRAPPCCARSGTRAARCHPARCSRRTLTRVRCTCTCGRERAQTVALLHAWEWGRPFALQTVALIDAAGMGESPCSTACTGMGKTPRDS